MSGNEKLPLSEDDREAMLAAAHEAVAYRAGLNSTEVKSQLRPADFALQFDTTLPDHGASASSVIDDLVAVAGKGIQGFTSPRFFGYVCGGPCQKKPS